MALPVPPHVVASVLVTLLIVGIPLTIKLTSEVHPETVYLNTAVPAVVPAVKVVPLIVPTPEVDPVGRLHVPPTGVPESVLVELPSAHIADIDVELVGAPGAPIVPAKPDAVLEQVLVLDLTFVFEILVPIAKPEIVIALAVVVWAVYSKVPSPFKSTS